MFIMFNPSRRTLKPAPHESPSRQTLKLYPHETSPSTTLNTPILTVVLNYSILFPSFTFFLDGFHLAFGDKFEICIKTTDLM